MKNRPGLLFLSLAAGAAAWGVLVSVGYAQPTYSIDFQGPTAAPIGGVVSDGDILTAIPPGTIAPPAVVIPALPGAGSLGLTGAGIHGSYEVDALSYGLDPALFPSPPIPQVFSFSADEFAFGLPGVPGPSLTTEGAGGLMEASADIFIATIASPPGGLPAPGPPILGGNVHFFDGNGSGTPFLTPGLNLVEPNPLSVGALPDVGDNLDAWDIGSPAGSVPVFFSLDSSFGDPFEPFPANTGTAVAQGFVGGDVLVSPLTGAAPGLYADSRFLGLNGGIPTPAANTLDIDDLDALILWENGDGFYQPTTGPYSWLAGSDMLLYSLRRNSALLLVPGGTLDALGSGLAITEGDILIPVETVPGSGVFAPGIFIPAETLGLDTVRSGGGFVSGLAFPNPRFGIDRWDDDLDALDVQVENIIPEPTSMMLLLCGIVGLACRKRR